MRSKSTCLFLAAFLLASCAAPTPQATVIPQTSEVSETSEVLTATPTSTPTSIPTSTQTPEPTLPSYGVIAPNIGEKLKAEGIVIPEELKNPEYKLDFATEYFEVHWTEPYPGVKIPIGVVPEKGIAYGKYHIKGIGATQEAWNAYAEQHIKYMWIHYREYGDPADREITLEQYVELLKAGRGGFEIPQYNPETGFFDKKAMVNPLSGYVKIISDNTKKELPLKGTTENSWLFYVDANGVLWVVGNDLEFSVEKRLDPSKNVTKVEALTNDLGLASSLISGGSAALGLSSTFCLSTDNAVASCVSDGAQIQDKYQNGPRWITSAYEKWFAKYKAGDRDAQRPIWLAR